MQTAIAFNFSSSHSRPHFPQFIPRQQQQQQQPSPTTATLSSPNYILNLSLASNDNVPSSASAGNSNANHTGNPFAFVTTNIMMPESSTGNVTTTSFVDAPNNHNHNHNISHTTPQIPNNPQYFHLMTPLASLYQQQPRQLQSYHNTIMPNPQTPPIENSNYSSPVSSPSSPPSSSSASPQFNCDDSFSLGDKMHHRSQYKARRGRPLAQFVTPLSVEPKLRHLTRQKLKHNYSTNVPETQMVQSSCNQHSYKVESVSNGRRQPPFHSDPGYLFELTDDFQDADQYDDDLDDPVICEGYLSDSNLSSSGSSCDLRYRSPSPFYSSSDEGSNAPEVLMDKLHRLEQMIGSDSLRSSRALY